MDSSPPPSGDALAAEVERLRARITELEAERDDYAQQISELFVLQQVFSTINSTLAINDILSTVLRGVVEALRFNRVVLFDVLEDGTVVRRMECDGYGRVVPCADPHDFRPGSTLDALARGELQLAHGTEADRDRPLQDTRNIYALAPLVARDVVRGLLYADDPPNERISENQTRMLLDFASQAAIAVENARLYEQTRRLLEETQRLALTDSLTGIANRRALYEMLERELQTSERYETPFAFAIFDLDDLKHINDTNGHGVGDLALRRFAHVLRSCARKGDIVARYAGDEFVVVLAQTGLSQARRGIERMLATLQRNGLASSIGVAMFPADGVDAQSLFFAADEALYEAKQAGKNRSFFYGSKSARLPAAP